MKPALTHVRQVRQGVCEKLKREERKKRDTKIISLYRSQHYLTVLLLLLQLLLLRLPSTTAVKWKSTRIAATLTHSSFVVWLRSKQRTQNNTTHRTQQPHPSGKKKKIENRIRQPIHNIGCDDGGLWRWGWIWILLLLLSPPLLQTLLICTVCARCMRMWLNCCLSRRSNWVPSFCVLQIPNSKEQALGANNKYAMCWTRNEHSADGCGYRTHFDVHVFHGTPILLSVSSYAVNVQKYRIMSSVEHYYNTIYFTLWVSTMRGNTWKYILNTCYIFLLKHHEYISASSVCLHVPLPACWPRCQESEKCKVSIKSPSHISASPIATITTAWTFVKQTRKYRKLVFMLNSGRNRNKCSPPPVGESTETTHECWAPYRAINWLHWPSQRSFVFVRIERVATDSLPTTRTGQVIGVTAA